MGLCPCFAGGGGGTLTSTDWPGVMGSAMREFVEEAAMSKQEYPPGWDQSRVREVPSHYGTQDDDAQFAEIEAARQSEGAVEISGEAPSSWERWGSC